MFRRHRKQRRSKNQPKQGESAGAPAIELLDGDEAVLGGAAVRQFLDSQLPNVRVPASVLSPSDTFRRQFDGFSSPSHWATMSR